MFRERDLEEGDSPLFRDKAVSGELFKKKGTVPFFEIALAEHSC